MTAIFRSLALTVMAAALTTTGRSTRLPEPVPAGTSSFRVMTYNLLMTNVSPVTAQAIADADPDIVCLQETTDRWDKFLIRRLGGRYPHRVVGQHSDSWNGVSVLSKFPIRDVKHLPAQDQGWFESVGFTVDSPAGAVQILNVHLRPMINYHSRVIGYFTVQSIHCREVAALWTHLDPALPTIVSGDFNEGNGGKAARWLERSAALTDALPEFDFETPTWHGTVARVPMTYRLDHIMYSPRLRCFEAKVIKAGASDHYPVQAVFALASR